MERPERLMRPGKYKWADISKSETVTVTKPSGGQIHLIKAGNMYFTKRMAEIGAIPDQRLNMKRVQEMEARSDDVLICAFPKCGTHWIWEITKMLINGTLEYSPYPKETDMLEFHLPEEFTDMVSPRVFNCHYFFEYIPQSMIEKKCKIIYVMRNPKDAAVSLYHQIKNLQGEDLIPIWSDFIDIFQRGTVTYSNWFDHVLKWEKSVKQHEDHIMTVFYEDVKKDPVLKIEEIAKFLGVNYNEDWIAAVADKCLFKNMKEAKIQHRATQYKDTEMLKRMVDMTHKLYRKGEVGDWKNYFTVAQNEEFDAIFKEKMKDSSFREKFELYI